MTESEGLSQIWAPDLLRDFAQLSEGHEFFVDGDWRTLVNADRWRYPDSPLLLWSELPLQLFRVPMDSHIVMRRITMNPEPHNWVVDEDTNGQAYRYCPRCKRYEADCAPNEFHGFIACTPSGA